MRQCSETNSNILKSLLCMSFICSIESIKELNGRKKNFHSWCWLLLKVSVYSESKIPFSSVQELSNYCSVCMCVCVCLKVLICCSGTMSLDAHWEAGLGHTELTGFLTEKLRTELTMTASTCTLGCLCCPPILQAFSHGQWTSAYTSFHKCGHVTAFCNVWQS